MGEGKVKKPSPSRSADLKKDIIDSTRRGRRLLQSRCTHSCPSMKHFNFHSAYPPVPPATLAPSRSFLDRISFFEFIVSMAHHAAFCAYSSFLRSARQGPNAFHPANGQTKNASGSASSPTTELFPRGQVACGGHEPEIRSRSGLAAVDGMRTGIGRAPRHAKNDRH